MAIIKLLIAEGKDELRNNIIRMLKSRENIVVVGEAKNGHEALEKIKELQPHIVLMELDLEIISGLKVTEILSKEHPNVLSIIMSTKALPEYFRQAIQSGAKDFLVKPFSLENLIEAIDSVYNKWLKDKKELFTEDKSAKVITFFATKGGVGRTTLAVNLACELASRGKKTLLIDASLQFGDVTITMDLRPKNTINNVVDSCDFTADSVLRRLTKHEESGLEVLVAPKSPELAEAVTANHLQRILDAVKPIYQYIVVDMPASITEKELVILDRTSILLLVATLEITSLKNTKTCLKTLQEIKYDLTKARIVLNKEIPDVGIDKSNLEASLGIPVIASIPMDAKISQVALNKGKPFVLESPRELLSRTIIDLADKITGNGKKPVNANKNALLRIKDLLFGS